jgi:hypothetical protein
MSVACGSVEDTDTSNGIGGVNASVDATPGTIGYYFPDVNLAAAVGVYLEKEISDIVTQDELDGIESLIATDVRNWQGVSLLPNITLLYIGQSEGYDIQYLEGLKNTPNLTLAIGYSDSEEFEYTMTGDIEVFSDFVDLRELYFWYPFSITGDLSSLPSSLRGLRLEGDGVTGSLTDLERMTDLDTLYLYECSQIRGSSDRLKYFPSLRDLALVGDTNIDINFADVCALTQLVDLTLRNYDITGDLGMLSNLTNLRGLGLSDMPNITGDLNELSKFDGLEGLALNNYRITGDIAILSNFDNLQYMNLSSTSVSGDVKSISGLTDIFFVGLSDTQVVGTVSDFANIPLEEFYVARTQVTGNLADLGKKESLRYVDLSQTSIRVKLEDSALFPNMSPWFHDDTLIQPMIDTANSQLVYQLGLPDQEGNHITIRTNKSDMGFANLFIDSVEVHDYEFTYEKVDEQTHAMQGDLTIGTSYLEGLSAGEHTVTLDFYWGGSVSTTITIATTP